MSLVGVTIIYTTDTLGSDVAQDELLDWAYGAELIDEGPGREFTALKVFTFEAGIKLRWRERIRSAWRALRSE